VRVAQLLTRRVLLNEHQLICFLLPNFSEIVAFTSRFMMFPYPRHGCRKLRASRTRLWAVLSLGGDDPASDDFFDICQLLVLNRNRFVILDRKGTGPGLVPKEARTKTRQKCQYAGIGCPLTDRRATENYFTPGAIANLYENVPLQLSHYSHYQPLIDLIPSFSKYDNGTIAAQMDWADIADTDVGQAIEGFLRR
jgi:hypothetical protein